MATSYTSPGVYVEEVSAGTHPIVPLGVSTAGFVGEAPDPTALVNVAWPINNWSEFVRHYVPEGAVSTPLSHAVFGYFLNGGARCYIVNTDVASYEAILSHCELMKDRVAILDCQPSVPNIDLLTKVGTAAADAPKD